MPVLNLSMPNPKRGLFLKPKLCISSVTITVIMTSIATTETVITLPLLTTKNNFVCVVCILCSLVIDLEKMPNLVVS